MLNVSHRAFPEYETVAYYGFYFFGFTRTCGKGRAA